MSIIKTNARQISKEIYDQVIRHTTFSNQGFEVTELREGDKTLLTLNYSSLVVYFL